MAIELKQTFTINLGAIVSNAVEAVKAVRSSENARKESEYQKAVADGMTYSAQLDFRQKQLEEAKASGFVDEDYTAQLESAIANTKKLARYDTIRIKYKDSLDDYVNGKESIKQHINILQDLLDSEQDPTLQSEIRTQLSDARKEQSTIELNAIKNRALVAQKDNSQKLIDGSIDEIKSRRSLASINGNDDEVAMWDETLIALKSSKSKLSIENGLNEITFQTNKYNLKANDKLGLLNNYLNGADAGTAITYDGVTYPSLKAYWENKRGEYLQNGYFDDVKKELDSETVRIAATSAYGQVPVPRIDAVSTFYNDLKTRPEFAPFADKIEQQRVDTVNSLVTNLADSIYNEADATGNKAKAQTAIQTVENKFGIKVAREPFAGEKATIASTATADANAIGKPGGGAIPAAGGGNTHVVAAGENLSVIARNNNMTLQSLLDLNPTYKSNPNAVKSGATINLAPTVTQPAPGTPPVTPTLAPPVSTPPGTPPAGTPAQPKPTTPTPSVPAKPTVPTPAAAPVPAPAAQPAQPVNKKIYVVKPGDTLSAIALRELGDASKAFDLKTESGTGYDAKNAGKLQIGTRLVIPT